MFELRDIGGWNEGYLCIGVEHQGKVIVPKHYQIDGELHYSAGICRGCVMVHRMMRDVDRFAFDVFEGNLRDRRT